MPKLSFNEEELSKGQLRKLNALRKSLGHEIADKAFAEWYATQAVVGPPDDQTAQKIGEVLGRLVVEEGLSFPRGGYIVRRGRGRVIVEPAASV